MQNYKPAVIAPIRPLAWKPPNAAGVALEKAKRQKKKKNAISNAIKLFTSFDSEIPPLKEEITQKKEKAIHKYIQGNIYNFLRRKQLKAQR